MSEPLIRFEDIGVQTWFRLSPDGPSYRKSSPFGYYYDSVMGEIWTAPDVQVFPVGEGHAS